MAPPCTVVEMTCSATRSVAGSAMVDGVRSIGLPLEDVFSNRVKSRRIASKKLKLIVQFNSFKERKEQPQRQEGADLGSK